jgi:glycerophosphoryl diester phosphodiesterase
MKIIAHRGASNVAPENTMAAFKKAYELGARAVELDVHLSQDGKLIVHHDYALGRPDTGKGLIINSEWEYISSLDAGKWFSEAYAGEKIPLLNEVFFAFGSSVEYELELKGTSDECIQKVLDLAKSMGVFNQIEFTSPHLAVLHRLKELEPEARIGIFFSSYPDWLDAKLGEKIILDTMRLSHASVAHLPLAIITGEFVSRLQQSGFTVHAADCNEPTEMKKADECGCDQLSTNCIQEALQLNG